MFSRNTQTSKRLFRLPIFCLQFLLVLYFCKFSYCQSERLISVSLSCYKEQVGYSEPNKISPKLVPVKDANFLDPIILKFTITNKSTKKTSVLYPDFRSEIIKLKLIDISTGQQVHQQVGWNMFWNNDFIEIQPGETFDVLLYLEQLYPDGISSGDYELKLEYSPYSKAWMQTNSIFLSLKSQNKQQNENYLKFRRNFEMSDDIELFLKENPVGLYQSRIYERIASDQVRLKKYEDAIKTIDKIISGNTTTTFQKGKALEFKAGILREYMGKQDEAFECIEKSPLRSSHLQAELWKNQAEKTKEAIKNSSIPYLEQRLESSIWQVRYSLVGELNGHDELTKQLLEKLIKDEHSMVRNQATVRYLGQYVYLKKQLFDPFSLLSSKLRYEFEHGLPKANNEWVEVSLRQIDTSTNSNFIIPAEPNDIIIKLENPTFSEEPVTIIGILGDRQDAKALFPFLDSTNDSLALTAAKSVIRLGETDKGVQTLKRIISKPLKENLHYITESLYALREVQNSDFERLIPEVLKKVKQEKDIQPDWMSAFLMLATEVDKNALD